MFWLGFTFQGSLIEFMTKPFLKVYYIIAKSLSLIHDMYLFG